jgi:hypothetical protein
MVAWEEVLALGVVGLAAGAAIAGHLAGRPMLRADEGFSSTIVGEAQVRFRVQQMGGEATTDCCSIAELMEAVGGRRGQVLRVVDLDSGDEEYV